MAAGPDFKKDYSFSETFANTNVYGLMARLMRISAAANNGSFTAVSHLLRHAIPEAGSSADAAATAALASSVCLLASITCLFLAHMTTADRQHLP